MKKNKWVDNIYQKERVTVLVDIDVSYRIKSHRSSLLHDLKTQIRELNHRNTNVLQVRTISELVVDPPIILRKGEGWIPKMNNFFNPQPKKNPVRLKGAKKARFIEDIYIRDGYRCLNCKTRKFLSPHHIIPYSLGGGDTEDNVVTLCITPWASCHDLAQKGELKEFHYTNET